MAECKDKKCPVHGEISVRGNIFTGVVVSAKPGKTAIVEREIVRFVPKYERYKKSKSRVYAHNPDCIAAKEDDVVRVGETRKLSKTKSFAVLEVLGKKRIVKAEEDTLAKKERKKAGKEKEEEKVKPEKEEKALREEKGREKPAKEEEKGKEEAGKEEKSENAGEEDGGGKE